ncbi:MAG: RsmB/NOP family class I SAM-dependent RNA methyltransferase, partial [Nanoarchaeota archaeon]
QPRKAIRCNTLKISPEELVDRLRKKGWEIEQPFMNFPEIIIVKSELNPGEIGKTREHILGYYYVQEITSIMPIIALNPRDDESVLDLCAAPGSKTTQLASIMNNSGSIIANDVSIGRIRILVSNLERCGVTNTIVVRHNAIELCEKLKKLKIKFDKILVDAPCSGEGNLRCSPRTLLEWSEGLLESLGKKQKKILNSALELLEEDGEIVYSTCTYAPEENESVIQNFIEKNNFEVVHIDLPLKTRPGILEWKKEKYDRMLLNARRIYHHDNDMEGFFVCKLRKG